MKKILSTVAFLAALTGGAYANVGSCTGTMEIGSVIEYKPGAGATIDLGFLRHFNAASQQWGVLYWTGSAWTSVDNVNCDDTQTTAGTYTVISPF